MAAAQYDAFREAMRGMVSSERMERAVELTHRYWTEPFTGREHLAG